MKTSAGILLYKRTPDVKVFLVHSGGPFWAKKDLGTWSIPKGLVEDGENLKITAARELNEELGTNIDIYIEKLIDLGNVTQKNGKIVYGFAYETDLGDIETHSNTISIEWPPKSGKNLEIPEIDRGEWFDIETAKTKANPHQKEFIERLLELI